MDTPDKKIQPSPSFLSTFEDSPVFNFINTLSPIKSYSFSHRAQSIPLLSFDSPQSLQTPPPTNCPKESKITSVLCPRPQKDKLGSSEEAVDSSTVKHESLSPQKNVVECDDVHPICELNMAEADIFPAEVIQGTPKEADTSPEEEMVMQGIQVEHNKDVCEWEKFIYEASDMLNCPSATKKDHNVDQEDKVVDLGTSSFATAVLQHPNEDNDGSQIMESVCPIMSTENQGATQPDETSHMPAVKAHAVFAEEVVQYSRTEVDDKTSQQQHMTSRRCLVYEMSGMHYRKILSDPAVGSPFSESAAASPDTSNDKLAVKPGNSRFSSLLPGIGLHLNALAASGRDKLIVKSQNLTCTRQQISSPRTVSSINCPTPNVNISDTPIASEIVQRYCEEQGVGTQLDGNVCEKSTCDEGIEIPQSSPKKKRKKPENVGEADSCKRCNCKRSKCLKLYCECFAAGLYCVEPCNCQDCFNKPAHEDTVLETRRQIESRNPLAFAPKVIRCSVTPINGEELNKTPASARHKRGCNCKKSGCLKKYCECFQGGVGCSLSCRCEGCKNTFGRKEGTESFIFQEAKILKRCASDVSSQDDVSKTEENQATAELSNYARQPVRQPFHFGSIGAKFPLVSCGQSLQSNAILKPDDSNQIALAEDAKVVMDDEASDFMKGDYLPPTTSVKSTSPNCKRISPHCDFETSTGWKSCRKLILRSIPAVPTLTEDKENSEVQGHLQ